MPESIFEFGESRPAKFFREVIEPLADSFAPSDVAVYERTMQAWIAPAALVEPAIPARVETVYVLSRVTLGADVKITSIALDAMKQRFPAARIVLVGGRKTAELFAADPRITVHAAEYPRSGPVSARIAFGDSLRRALDTRVGIVVDPDSRMTQLGLMPPCDAERYFHFPSRSAGGEGLRNLTALTQDWLGARFGVRGNSYIAPERVAVDSPGGFAAVSFGVGGNMTKRVGGDFEGGVIRLLAARYGMVWADRGAGGEEAERMSSAVAASGAADQVKFWEGSFAGFASITAQSGLYFGYDSAGQHAAAAAGVRLVTVFAGAASERFRARWSPAGAGEITVIDGDALSAAECLERVRQSLRV